MIKKILIHFFIFSAGISFSQQEKGIHYIGGMYYGAGFHNFTTPVISQSVLVNNVGGRLAFSIGKYFRIGIMGGNTFKHYDENASSYKIGHGGLTGEFNYKANRLNAGLGIYTGGGKYRNLYVTGKTGNSITGDYRNESFMFFVPFATASYSLTTKLSLSCMIEYFDDMLFSKQLACGGTNVKIGILFSR